MTFWISEQISHDRVITSSFEQTSLRMGASTIISGFISGFNFRASRIFAFLPMMIWRMWISRIFSWTNNQQIHERVEERIRELQGVKVRAGQGQWQSQRRERNSAECSHDQGDILGNKDVEGGVDDVGTVDTNGEKGRGCKRDSSHLVGKALAMAMDSPSKTWGKEGSEGAGIWYDCNICLDLAKDPVLTCCGDLFCWACFYQLGYIDSTSKECPVCKGVVEWVWDGVWLEGASAAQSS